MDTVRYWLALLVVIAWPVGVGLWLLIHPFARFWRRVGWVATYAIVSLPCLALAAGLFAARQQLLAVEYGTRYPLVALGAVCLVAGGAISGQRRRQLTMAILAGLPELSPETYPPRLLTEGIYARIRHPRYVEALLFVLGYALVANYLAAYVVVGLSVPALWVVVGLEERELRERFGTAYTEYCARVPRFFPRSSG